jgi:hypothetical protein
MCSSTPKPAARPLLLFENVEPGRPPSALRVVPLDGVPVLPPEQDKVQTPDQDEEDDEEERMEATFPNRPTYCLFHSTGRVYLASRPVINYLLLASRPVIHYLLLLHMYTDISIHRTMHCLVFRTLSLERRRKVSFARRNARAHRWCGQSHQKAP